MSFKLPDHDTLYAALLARDVDLDGRVFVGVSTTGIFCRLTCPARKPKPENCTFFETVGACIEAGFRACKRCHPIQPMAEADPAIKALLAALEQNPARRWSETDVTALGFDASTVRRSFRRHSEIFPMPWAPASICWPSHSRNGGLRPISCWERACFIRIRTSRW